VGVGAKAEVFSRCECGARDRERQGVIDRNRHLGEALTLHGLRLEACDAPEAGGRGSYKDIYIYILI